MCLKSSILQCSGDRPLQLLILYCLFLGAAGQTWSSWHAWCRWSSGKLSSSGYLLGSRFCTHLPQGAPWARAPHEPARSGSPRPHFGWIEGCEFEKSWPCSKLCSSSHHTRRYFSPSFGPFFPLVLFLPSVLGRLAAHRGEDGLMCVYSSCSTGTGLSSSRLGPLGTAAEQ